MTPFQHDGGGATLRLHLVDKIRVGFRIKRMQALEFIRFDSVATSLALGVFYLIRILFALVVFGRSRSLRTVGALFRHTRFNWARRFASRFLGRCIFRSGAEGLGRECLNLTSTHIDESTVMRLRQEVLDGKRGLFGRRLLILSPPENGKKGVLLVKFTEYFKYFLTVFDIARVSERYILVAEPSSSGYFDEELLCLLVAKTQVIVESPEPIDLKFIEELSASLFPTEVGANCWVDPRVFYPIAETKKEFDVIVVSNWADVKRHYHLFQCLSETRNKQLRVALVGKPWPKSLEDIRKEAAYFHVSERLIFFENLTQEELNRILNKSKSYLLLSKKEGINKATMEALFAGVPVYLLKGFNYGYSYPYINDRTGGFIDPSKLTSFLDRHDEILGSISADFSSVRADFSPQRSTERIIEIIAGIERKCSIEVNKALAVKVNLPELEYYDVSTWSRYSQHYRKLAEYLHR